MIFFIASFSTCPSSTFQVTFLFLNCRLPLCALLAFSSASLAFSLKRIIPYTKRKIMFALQSVVKLSTISLLKAIPQPSTSVITIFNASYWILGRNALKVNSSQRYRVIYTIIIIFLVHHAFSWHVPPTNLVTKLAHYPSVLGKKGLKDKSKWLSRNHFNQHAL